MHSLVGWERKVFPFWDENLKGGLNVSPLQREGIGAGNFFSAIGSEKEETGGAGDEAFGEGITQNPAHRSAVKVPGAGRVGECGGGFIEYLTQAMRFMPEAFFDDNAKGFRGRRVSPGLINWNGLSGGGHGYLLLVVTGRHADFVPGYF